MVLCITSVIFYRMQHTHTGGIKIRFNKILFGYMIRNCYRPAANSPAIQMLCQYLDDNISCKIDMALFGILRRFTRIYLCLCGITLETLFSRFATLLQKSMAKIWCLAWCLIRRRRRRFIFDLWRMLPDCWPDHVQILRLKIYVNVNKF